MPNPIRIKFKSSILFLIVPLLFIVGCNQLSFDEPIVSLDAYHIEKGFQLQAIASEPFIEAPVSMDFDNNGRIWVVEMKGYMQNLEGTGKDIPNGTITILEDLDDDGITDHSKIFIDSLVLPRAIAHVYGGLLYAEPPNLWFVDIKNDKPVNKVLVDSLYSDGGNVEHQPNGLMMHIDNWIYSAKSNSRYQKKHGKWIKEVASLRGQWGISKDNFGRLYYNNNSTQLIGDYVLPNVSIKNPYYKPNASLNKILTPDQRVYPLHPTSVNRGYQKGVLDKDSLLINVTSACGPMIYRGDKFPKNYHENAFVCVPEANIVKRNILTFDNVEIKAQQAIPNEEFIASTDEGFRPVNVFNGPDGNMYIVDMHRGIIQDKAFLSPYLQKHYAAKKLDTIIGMGRILKVSNQNKTSREIINIEKLSSKELVDLLSSPNGWLRDRAQQLVVFKDDKSVIPKLKEIVADVTNPITQIHALHTLNGLNTLDYEVLKSILSSNAKRDVIIHALVLFEEYATPNSLESGFNVLINSLQKNDEVIDLYISYTLGKWTQISPEKFFTMLLELSKKYDNNKVYQEAIVNSLRGVENEFLAFSNQFKSNLPIGNILSEILNQTLNNKSKDIKNSIYTSTSVGTDARTAGFKLFRNKCATCHGVDGDGIEGLAPPLKNSEYIKDSAEKLALVILHGLSGPIHVNGKLYDTNVVMPGLANNPDFTDKDLQDIISYVNNAFSNKYKNISIEKIKELRALKPKDGGTFTEKELLELKYQD